MVRCPRSCLGPLLALLSIPGSGLAQEPRPTEGWPWDPDVTNVSASSRHPRPVGRIDNHRQVIATEFLGGWRTYLGDLHAHSRGHADGGASTPTIRRDEVNRSAWSFGYDFIAITNHSTSWKLYDELAPTVQSLSGTRSIQPPDLLALKGVESYTGPRHSVHFNVFNRLILMNSERLETWHDAILARYADDPVLSTHVQLNHPDPEEPWFRLPPEDQPERRQRVREAVELAEYKGLPSYFELLRRGFRVAPVSNTDSHASFEPWRGVDSRGRTFAEEPGVPPEKWKDVESGQRTGLLLPADETLSYEGLLWAMRLRWAFSTSVAGASGFFVVNQRTMGSELTLAPGEARLDFTIWGSTRGGRVGHEVWTRLEVWSPSQPERPLRVIEYQDATRVDLREELSLTPYESIYVVRLERERPEAEVILAPVWITNPIARPRLVLEGDGPSGVASSCLRLEGGGPHLLLQRQAPGDEDGDWRTVGPLEHGEGCIPLAPEALSPRARWRVVDALQPEVVSAPVELPARSLPVP